MKELTNSPFSRRRTAAFAFGALSPEEVECFLSRLNEQGGGYSPRPINE